MAHVTGEGLHSCMLSEVAADVARFVEDLQARIVQAPVLLYLAFLHSVEEGSNLVFVGGNAVEFRL